MRYKQVLVAFELLQEMMTQGWDSRMKAGVPGRWVECTQGLPEGAKFVRAWLDDFAARPTWHIVFHHESFDELADSSPIPELMVMFNAHQQEA